MPTPTDLVTDLPADFEVFGQAVDTSLADLKGGTTGQILSKATGTDMDFAWITNDVGDITGVTAGTGISGGGTSGAVTVTNSMATAIDAKGDLIAGTGADAFSRLAVGTNGQLLAADSTAATGLAWVAAPSSGGMTLLSTTTLSGASTTISSISQAYNNLYILINNFSGTANSHILIAPNGSTNITNYAVLSNNNPGTYDSNTHLKPMHTTDISNTSTTGTIALQIFNYTSTNSFKTANSLASYFWPNGSAEVGVFVFSAIETTSAITSLTFTMNTGNFDAGTVLIYGVK